MTSYIEHQTERPLTGSLTPHDLFPMASAARGWIALWSLPLTTFQIWSSGWATLFADRQPETDRHQDGDQLPVPNSLQDAKDRELFA